MLPVQQKNEKTFLAITADIGQYLVIYSPQNDSPTDVLKMIAKKAPCSVVRKHLMS